MFFNTIMFVDPWDVLALKNNKKKSEGMFPISETYKEVSWRFL